jgi:anaerobic magnesium-protoporphyrin IX monomethyl ester cyclase
MKILLLNPPTREGKAFIREGRCNQEQGVWATLWPPVTLAAAGAVLEHAGKEVTVLDCPALQMTRIDLLKKIAHVSYDLIAWSTATPSISEDLDLADEIKAIRPEINTVVFGAHVTALAQECLMQKPRLDYIVRNEPEQSLVELANALEKREAVATVAGISFREASGEVIHNPARAFIENLDSLPFPAWHLLDLDRYRLPLLGEKFLILSPIRGCPYPCTFCTAHTYYGKKLRKRSPARMIEEIRYDTDRFGIQQFFIWADTFTADKAYVAEFCTRIIENRISIGWTCNSRVDTVDRELLELMKKAGCWMISYGIESADQKVLDEAGKKITADQARKAVDAARQAGIKVSGHFVLGLPGDTEDSIRKTVDFSLSLNLDTAQYYCAVPFPGSALYTLAGNRGWIDGNTPFEAYRQDQAVMQLPGLDPKEVDAWRKKAYIKFYFRPGCILALMRLMRLRTIPATLKGGISFLRWAMK